MPKRNPTNESSVSRRHLMKATGAAAATGALGALAGCTGDGGDGGDGGGGDGGAGGGGDGGDGGGGDGGDGDGGGSETVEISYLSAKAAESSAVTTKFKNSMRNFESQQGSITVNLQTASYGDIKNKLSSTVGAGNQPALAEAGTLGLSFFFDGTVPAHSTWIEETEGYPDEWSVTNQTAANFRGEWWSGGAPSGAVRGINIVPKLVSQVGVTDPFEEMSTWSGVYDVIQRIDSQLDTIAWETSGVYNDLEGYWAKARTSYTNGNDPWIRGDPTNPEVLVGEEPATDGMIKNTIKLANEYSSVNAATLADEEKANILLTGKAAIFSHGGAGIETWTSVKEDVNIGWDGGEGDVMYIPDPKLDPEYGSRIGISELEGVEGAHGEHVSALENSHTVFNMDDQKKMDAAWTLNTYLQTDPNHMIPISGETGRGIPLWKPMLQTFLDELSPPQTFAQGIETFQELGPQAQSTGAEWDVGGTDQIRWTDLNETMSQTIAGQHTIEETPSLIREKILTTLEEENS